MKERYIHGLATSSPSTFPTTPGSHACHVFLVPAHYGECALGCQLCRFEVCPVRNLCNDYAGTENGYLSVDTAAVSYCQAQRFEAYTPGHSSIAYPGIDWLCHQQVAGIWGPGINHRF